MRNTKKAISILLCLMMVLGMMSTFAFAETTAKNTITINKIENDVDRTYVAYQIFKGKLSTDKTKLSDIDWGTGVVEKDSDGNAITYKGQSTASEIAKVIGSSEADARVFAVEINKHLSTICNTLTENEAKTAYTAELAPGYYLIKDETTGLTEGQVSSDFIVKVIKDQTVSPKGTGDKPDFDKKANKTTASINDILTYTLTYKVPLNYASYKDYTITFADSMSNALDYIGNVTVKVGDTVIVNKADTPAVENTNVTIPEDTTQNGEKQDITFVINAKAIPAITPGSTVTMTYQAKVVGENPSNTVIGTYPNDPKSDGKGTITPPEVVTKTYNINLHKVDGVKNEDGSYKSLTGADFELRAGDKTTVILKIAGNGTTAVVTEGSGEDAKTVTNRGGVDATGSVYTFKGLAAGTYYLVETEAPDGYNTLTEAIKVVIDENGNVQFGTGTPAAQGTAIAVENFSGSTLPGTGGIGTTIFYLIGAILVIGAGVVFVTRRRMHSDK